MGAAAAAAAGEGLGTGAAAVCELCFDRSSSACISFRDIGRETAAVATFATEGEAATR